VRKMTSFPAARLGLADRGGAAARDESGPRGFDPAPVTDTATYTQPHQYAEGVLSVVVNGQVAFEKGGMTAARPGRVLHGAGRRQ
jgi:N-acyl-D-amino-acid deacylase